MRPMFALAHKRRPLRGRSLWPARRTRRARLIWLAALTLATALGAALALPGTAPAAPGNAAATPLYSGGRSLAADKPRTPPTRPLNMHEAVERALHSNPSLGSQEAQSKSTEETRKSARGAFGPKLGMSYTATRTDKDYSPSYTVTQAPKQGVYTWGVEVSQPVFTGFKLLADYQKAALQAESDKASLRSAELSMTEEVQTQFLNYLRYEESVRSAEDSLARLRDQLRITQAFYDVGLRPRLDVLQAEVDVRKAESTLIQAENSRDTSLARLNTLLGLPAQAATRYVGSLDHVPFTRSLEQCLEVAYRQRPDLYIAAKSVAIAGKNRQAVQSGYYPQVEAYYNVAQTGNTMDLQRVGDQGYRGTTWEVGAKATWDVFQWGTTYYADQSAGWLVTKVRYEEENLKLNVGYDIKSKLLAVRDAEKRIAVAETAVDQATEAYNVALARYQEQVGTNFDVLDASSNLTAAQASLTSAKADYLTALAQIYVAMGEFRPDLARR